MNFVIFCVLFVSFVEFKLLVAFIITTMNLWCKRLKSKKMRWMFLSGNCNTNIKVVNVRTRLNKTVYDPVSQV